MQIENLVTIIFGKIKTFGKTVCFPLQQHIPTYQNSEWNSGSLGTKLVNRQSENC